MKQRIALILLAIFGIAATTVLLARARGPSSAELMIERLQVVWPSVMSMPREERAHLGSMGVECGLSRLEMNREAIVTCLGTGAAALDRRDAPDLRWSRKLDELLQRSS